MLPVTHPRGASRGPDLHFRRDYRREAPPVSAGSWWIAAPREGFTAHAEAIHGARMAASPYGRLLGKPITIEE